MSEYNNDNRLAIWKNDKKESDTHPDFKGQGMVNGVEVWVSAWKRKDGANPNAPALSISVQAKDDVHKQGVDNASQAAQGNSEPEFDDDIPF